MPNQPPSPPSNIPFPGASQPGDNRGGSSSPPPITDVKTESASSAPSPAEPSRPPYPVPGPVPPRNPQTVKPGAQPPPEPPKKEPGGPMEQLPEGPSVESLETKSTVKRIFLIILGIGVLAALIFGGIFLYNRYFKTEEGVYVAENVEMNSE